MNKMRNTMKCMTAIFVMAMAFMVTGITAQAAVDATVVNDIAVLPPAPVMTVDFAAGEQAKQETINVPAKGAVIIYAVGTTDATINIAGLSGNLYIYANEGTKNRGFEFSQAGAYTLNITRSSYEAKAAGTVRYQVYFIHSGETAVSQNQTTAYYSQNYNDPAYTKITVKSTGYIGVATPTVTSYGSTGSTYVTLLNSKKKAVSDELYAYNSDKSPYIKYFAVTKGTYYIKTRSSVGSMYNVLYVFEKVKEKSGSSKAKAVEIKAGKTKKGVLTANGKQQSDWYKVRLTKKKKLKLVVTTFNTDDGISLKIIPANKRMRIIGDTRTLYSSKKNVLKSENAWQAGIYYLQVTKKNKKASGYYSIKFSK